MKRLESRQGIGSEILSQESIERKVPDFSDEHLFSDRKGRRRVQRKSTVRRQKSQESNGGKRR
jgi:hypothetical protein